MSAHIVVCEYLDRVLEQDRVGHQRDFARHLADMRFTQGDMFDLADDAFALDHVTDAHLLAQHDEHTGEEVLEDILKGEADRDRADAEPGDQAGGRHTRHDHDQRDHQSDDPDAQLHDGVDQVLEGGAHVGLADGAAYAPHRDACDDPGDQKDHDGNRHIG